MSAAPRIESNIIDQGYVVDLIEAIGIDDYFDIVKTLQHEVDQQIATLEAQSRGSETGSESVKQTAHRLAGLLSQFGAFEVSAYAERVQDAPTANEANRLATALVDLCRASMAAIADLPLSPAVPGR